MSDKKNRELVYGRNACLACLSNFNRDVYCVYIHKDKITVYNPLILQRYKHLIKIVDSRFLLLKTNEEHKHQGIAIETSAYKTNNDINKINIAENQNILILDGVTDPHNLGNIIRTACCFNIKNIIIPKQNSCNITSAVVRSSAGYSEMVNLYTVSNLATAIEKLKQINFWIIGFDSNTDENASPLKKLFEKYNKAALVFGSEGTGMRALTKKMCDIIVKIPISNDVDSLNVATAVAIAGYETYVAKHGN